MADNSKSILTLLTEYEFREVVLDAINIDEYKAIINDIIDAYTVSAVTRTDIINVLDLFMVETPGATFDASKMVENIWNILLNLQMAKNKAIVKGDILKIIEASLRGEFDLGNINQQTYDDRLNRALFIIEIELNKINLINLDKIEVQNAIAVINSKFQWEDIDYTEVFSKVNDSFRLSIFKSNIITSFISLFGIRYSTKIKEMVDIIFNLEQTVVGIDSIIVQVLDSLNLRLTADGIQALKKQLVYELDKFKEHTGVADDSKGIIDMTPMSYMSSTLVVKSGDIESIEINPIEPVAYVNTEELTIGTTVDMVETISKVEEKCNITSKVIEPIFKVKVQCADSGIPLDEADTGKVLTNDGTEAYWDYISNIIGDQAGFLRIVDTLGERNEIPLHRRNVGMLVYVKSRDTYYKCESNTDDSWIIFKQGLYPHRVARTVIFENVKLGHGDTGSDLRVSDIKSTVINTEDEYKYIDEYSDVEYANLISFKNVGYKQAHITFDGNSHLLNPNSVFELPFDGTLRFKVKGMFNFVSAFVTFDTTVEKMKGECCDPIVRNHEQGSIFDPYF